MIRLIIRESGIARTVRVEADRLVLGTDPGHGLRLSGVGIEARHCLLRAMKRGFEVVDLGSREGVILDGSRVSRAPVAPGQDLVLGSTTVHIEALEAHPVPDPTAPRETPPPAPPPLVAGTGRTEPEFEERLFLAVRRSPPLLFSFSVHAVVALVWFLTTPAPMRLPAGPGVLMIEAASVLETTAIEEEAKATETDLPAVDDRELLLDDRPVLTGGVESRAEDAPADPPADALPEATLGFGGSDPRKRPFQGPRPVEFEANPTFDGQAAENANREAAGLLVRSLGGGGGGEKALLRRLDPRRIHVVRGTYDRVEDVFALLGLRHDLLLVEDLPHVPLHPNAILVIDCGTEHLGLAAARAVREFVQRGGYLVTTDWGLENVIEPTFPGVLQSLYKGGRGVSTQDEVVSMRLSSPGHPLVRGLRQVSGEGRWWVEDRAHPVKVLKKDRVTVLAESDEFRKRYGSGVLACVFDHGRGRVLHLLGHAWQKKGNLKGTFGMQRMIMNFLVERARTLRPELEAGNPAAIEGR